MFVVVVDFVMIHSGNFWMHPPTYIHNKQCGNIPCFSKTVPCLMQCSLSWKSWLYVICHPDQTWKYEMWEWWLCTGLMCCMHKKGNMQHWIC